MKHLTNSAIVIQLLRDVAVSVALFIVACIFAGWIQSMVTPNLRWLYIVWFAIGMLPCMYYLKFRGVGR